jgi:hypothetical protein
MDLPDVESVETVQEIFVSIGELASGTYRFSDDIRTIVTALPDQGFEINIVDCDDEILGRAIAPTVFEALIMAQERAVDDVRKTAQINAEVEKGD